jgi:hypothetical protein
VTDHGRKRGDKPSYPICVWNGIFDHYEKIGIAVWEFLWLIDAITDEQDGIGWVFGKSPLKIERIAADLGIGESTVRRNLDRLKDGGYIVTHKARYGLVVGVVNSRKIRPRTSNLDRSDMSGQESRPLESEHSDRSKVSELSPKSKRTGDSILIDNAVRQSSRTAVEATSAWRAIGTDKLGTPRFRAKWEFIFAHRNGDSIADAMERCIVTCQEAGISVPKPFYDAKRIVERKEEAPSKGPASRLEYLPAMPPLPCQS